MLKRMLAVMMVLVSLFMVSCPAEEAGDGWFCPNCGQENKAEYKFCMECGNPKPDGSWICSECGNKNEADYKFCINCGTKKQVPNPADTKAEAKIDPVQLTVFISNEKKADDMISLTQGYIMSQLGIELNPVCGDENDLKIMMASGETPDLFICSMSDYCKYASEGMLADISGYLASGDYTSLNDYVGDQWQNVEVGGAIYGVPGKINAPTEQVISINANWLDQLCMAMPQTLKEFYLLLGEFRNSFPNAYPISGYGEGIECLSFLTGAFGATAGREYILNSNGTVTINAISPQLKEAVKYLSELYSEGLIDVGIFYRTKSEVQVMWNRGEIGIWCHEWDVALNSAQSRAYAATIMPPVGEKGLTGIGGNSNTVSEVVAIGYQCDEAKIRAALKLLNFEADPLGARIVAYGAEDMYFEWNRKENQTTWTAGSACEGMDVYQLIYPERWMNQVYALEGTESGRYLYEASEARYQEPAYQTLDLLGEIEKNEEYAWDYELRFGYGLNTDLDIYYQQTMRAFITGEWDINAEWDAYVANYRILDQDQSQYLLDIYNWEHGTDYVFAN